MKLLLALVVLTTAVLSATSEKARFDNYRVYKVDVDTHDQLTALRQLSETSDSYSFWDEPTRIGSHVEVLVPPHQFAHFSELVEKFKLNIELINNNWQETIDKETPQKQPKAEAFIDWTAYHSTEAIYEWVDSIRAEFPQWITVEDIGRSFENRPLKVVKLSKRQNNRAVFIEANIHAREWISSATASFVLNEFLRSTDPEVQEIASSVDWYIIIVANPDGYEYSRSTNRNWRKTRSATGSLLCSGVDANRNFAFNWLVPDETGNLGASTTACSDTFAGNRAFSEPETVAIEEYLARNYEKFDVYLSFHSYAHMLLFPLGNTRVRVQNFDQHQAIGNAAADRLFGKHGIRYLVGNSLEALYATSGTSVDHAFGKYGIPIAFTYEMRGNGPYGNFGFVLPPHLIIPNAEEVLQSLIGLVQESRQHGYLQ